MALKAVIMAAGMSTRAYPLTLTRPKPLLKAANKTILQHNLEQLQETGLFDEFVIVVGYKAEMIQQAFGKEFMGIRITYAKQKEQLGSGDALLAAKPFLKKEFLVMNGDDLYFAEDIIRMVNERYAVLSKKVKDPERYGVYVVASGYAKMLVEKPKEFISNTANIGCYKLDMKVFDFEKEIEESERGEMEITDFISELMKKEKVKVIEAERWCPIAYAWDLLAANELMLKDIKKEIKGEIEANVTMKGEVIVGEGTVVKSGVYIEGPVAIGKNCAIGPNAYLRASTSIGDNCKIGHEVEIKNSIIFDNSAVPHLSYIGDSVIGENVNIGAGSVTANLRHDKGIIRTSMKKDIEGEVKEDIIETGLHKFGTIIGDNAKIGIKTIIYPGRKIWPGMSTLPGQKVDADVE
ncbi:glucose-1-phosphate thymidylyltransferase [Candidatus Woesearchaeota archaeon CG10_big_fil_rev_8_21_14_0_10_44_13]|nr:MAG: glucose-1-phosphate thymidylyltransferase [Candidatus Woesearchaeota archaeon CG10_big_fil_rev_8_21_14_0_10_44_13]